MIQIQTEALQAVRHLVANKRIQEPYDYYIGRYGSGLSKCFGNPFEIVHGDPNRSRSAVVADLETLLLHGVTAQAVEMRVSLHHLKGKIVGCFCSPDLCHGHVLAHHANSLSPGETLSMGGKIPRLTAPWIHVPLTPATALVLPQPLKTLATQASSLDDGHVAHARYPIAGHPFLECSSQGDRRFSAFNARLKDGAKVGVKNGSSIEEAYQLDVKGYRVQGNDWRLGKGKPPLKPVDLWKAYKALWGQWVDENPVVFADLTRLAKNHVLTDKFASSPISQARALAELLSERMGWKLGLPDNKSVKTIASATSQRHPFKASGTTPATHQGNLFEDGDLFAQPTRPRVRP